MSSAPNEPQDEQDNVRLSTLIVSVYLPALLFSTGWRMVIPVIPLFAKQMGATIAIVGLIVTMRGVGTLVMDLPSGMLVASLGNHRTLLLSSVGVVVTAVLTGFLHNVVWLAVFTFLLGSFQSSWLMSRLNYVRETVPLHQRGRALSLIGGSVRIGAFVGPIIGGYAGQYLGLPAVYLVQGGIAFVGLMLVLVGRNHFAKETPRKSHVPLLRSIGSVAVANRKILLSGGLVMLALNSLRASRQILFPLWGSSIGLDVGSIGLVIGLSSGIEMLLVYPAGLTMDRLGRKWAIIPCLTILSLSFFLLPLAATFVSLLAIGLLAGLGNGMGSGIVMTLGADFAPDEAAGEFQGLWRLIGDVGTASGPAAVGAIGEAVSLDVSPLLAGVVGVLGALIMLFFTPETRKARRPTG